MKSPKLEMMNSNASSKSWSSLVGPDSDFHENECLESQSLNPMIKKHSRKKKKKVYSKAKVLPFDKAEIESIIENGLSSEVRTVVRVFFPRQNLSNPMQRRK